MYRVSKKMCLCLMKRKIETRCSILEIQFIEFKFDFMQLMES